jgi:hypothetical protein
MCDAFRHRTIHIYMSDHVVRVKTQSNEKKRRTRNKYITVYAHETLEHIVFPYFAMYEYSIVPL